MTVTAPVDGDLLDPQWAVDVSDALNAVEGEVDTIGQTVAAKLIINNGNPVAVTSGTTELNMPLYALSGLNLTIGHFYMYTFLMTFTKTVAGDAFDMNLRANTALSGTSVSGSATNPTDGLTIGHRIPSFVFQAASAWTSLHLSIVRSSGSGTLSYFSSTTGSRAWCRLVDLGDNWATQS